MDQGVVAIHKVVKGFPLIVAPGLRHRNNADPVTLHEDLFTLESMGMRFNHLFGSIVHSLVREVVHMTDPGLLVLECHLPLGSSDQVIWESSALHNVVYLVGFPGHSQLDVPLELAFGMTHRALNAAKTITSEAPFSS